MSKKINYSRSNMKQIFSNIMPHIKPPEKISVSDHAEKYRVLDSLSSNYTGKWSNKVVPWLVEPMDAMGVDDPTKEVTLKYGSQMGKTEGINNAIIHRMDVDPCPISFYLPSEKQAKDYSKTRITPALKNNTKLSKIVTGKSRDSENTILSKVFPGGVLRLFGSNSTTDMAGTAAKLMCRDEINRWGEDTGGEGDGLALTAQRTESFGDDAKIINTSTPTTKGKSAISKKFEASDQKHWYVPCPHCEEYQELLFRRILPGQEKETRMMHFERTEAGLVTNAYMVCCHCGGIIEEEHKPVMQRKGKYIAHNPGHPSKGFFANGLNSLFMSWIRVGEKFYDGEGNYLALKAFINLVLAEDWEDPSLYIRQDSIEKRAEKYEKVPDEVLFISCAIDMQRDRLELEIVGWGIGFERWGLEYKVINGVYNEEHLWNELKEVLETPLTREDGREQKIMTTFIDAHDGTVTEYVNKFCASNKPLKVFAIHGRGGKHLKPIHKKNKDEKYHNTYLTLGVDTLKNMGAYALKIDTHGKGYCHFPKGNGYDSNYYKMLTSEEQKKKNSKSDELVWDLKEGQKRNEAWDIFGYNRAVIEYWTPNWERWSKIGPKGLISKNVVKRNRNNNSQNSIGGIEV